MRDKRPCEARRPLSEIEAEIAITKTEIDEKYYLLGKTVCDIADNDAGRIGELVNRLVQLKTELKDAHTERRNLNEPQ